MSDGRPQEWFPQIRAKRASHANVRHARPGRRLSEIRCRLAGLRDCLYGS
jgi:hypothetical protein